MIGLTARQAGFDLRLLLRNGEQILLTLLIPIALLLLLALAPVVALDVPSGSSRIEAALAGVLAVAVLSSAFTSLAIGIGFDRRSGCLLMLATTPLSRTTILFARALATLAVVLVQVLLLAITAALLGWRPDGGALIALALVILGALSLGALGFALGGAVRAEATLAIANGLFLILLLVGGTALPTSTLPTPVAAVVQWLPTAALGDALRTAIAGSAGSVPIDALVLVAWGAVGAVIAARTFRWD